MSIDELVGKIMDIINNNRLKPDNSGNWFSGKELDTLRSLFESGGYYEARLFQMGKIDRRDRPIQAKRNKTLLDILDLIHANRLEPRSGGYLIGKLNQILCCYEEERKHARQ